MRFMHLSDLHIGKRVGAYSMLDDQRYILDQILDAVDTLAPDGVFIAGDVYDKAAPSAEAVEVFDDFLYELARRRQKVFVISGNHDSPERIAFGARLLCGSEIYLSPVYCGEIAPVVLEDAWGSVCVYLLPYVKPVHVRRFFPDADIDGYEDAVRTAIAHMPIDKGQRNVLLTHQFITGATRSDSEDISVGGADNVDAAVFAPFDYVALGHLHGPQQVGRPTVRYCGTPLKYSFSEVGHNKSITLVELREKGSVTVTTVPLTPLRDLREIRGSYNQVTAKSFYAGTHTDDYLHITLTDEEDIPDAMGKLRTIYPNIMKLDYDNARTRAGCEEISPRADAERKSPLELFSDLYALQNGQEMSAEQRDFMTTLVAEIWEGGDGA